MRRTPLILAALAAMAATTAAGGPGCAFDTASAPRPCSRDGDCSGGRTCQKGKCAAAPQDGGSDADRPGGDVVCADAGATRILGESCGCDDDCESAVCWLGVCCDVPCAGQCASCENPGQRGTCSPVPAGLPDPRGRCTDAGSPTCSFDGTCNGTGGCRLYPAGTTCSMPVCADATSVSAKVCDGDGNCVPGLPVDCTPYRCNPGGGVAKCFASCTGAADCAPMASCATAGSCGPKPTGAACVSSADCASGACADGVCCSTDCTGPCRRCNQVGALGLCRFVPAMAPDPRKLCAAEAVATCGHTGTCDGSGGCAVYPEGQPCATGKRCRKGACAAGTDGGSDAAGGG